MTRKVDISTSTLFRFILIILGLAFLYLIRDVLLILFFAVIITAAVEAPVDWLKKKGVKRIFAVLIVYAVTFSILAGIVYLIIPPLGGQIKNLVVNLPDITSRLGFGLESLQQKYQGLDVTGLLHSLANKVQGVTPDIFQTTFSFFGGIFSALMVLVISFYLTFQENGLKKFLVSVVPGNHKEYVADLANRLEEKLGGWLRGELILMFSVGMLVFIGLTILGIKYALVLALLVGLLEIIPYFGPLIAVIPAVILAFFQAPWLAIAVAILYYVVQQLENYILVPLIMKKTLGLNPVIIILSLLIGAKIGGVVGMVAAVPLAAMASVFLGDVFKDRE